MSEALVPAAAEPAVVTDRGAAVVLPALIVDAGPAAVERFLEFFAGRIANPRTRAAYGRAVGQFLASPSSRITIDGSRGMYSSENTITV